MAEIKQIKINETTYDVGVNSHTHAAGDITSGTIAAARLPTASTSAKGAVTFTTTVPVIAGTAAVGSSTSVSRSDHVHPAQTTISGNAGSATKLQTTRYLDGIAFNGSTNVTRYATCSTAAATAAKTCTVTAGTFSLITGARVLIKFTVTNTASSPTLNVNSTGAKAIMYRGSAISKSYLAANRIYEFVYDGTDWELIGDINTNTTYTLSSFVEVSETEPTSTTKLWLKPKV